MEWWQILLIVLGSVLLLLVLSIVFYKPFFKRFWDMVLSGLSIVILSPLFLILIISGSIAMKGNPFYLQRRPGRKDKEGKERMFSLIKFRSMSNKKDKDGKLLPDKERLNKYGRTIRALSLDELPELINIFVGDMSIVGPRPLAEKYLDYYTEEERHRHDVRPGLTGLAQANGRNGLSWEEKFKLDLEYINTISFLTDFKIIFLTIRKVLVKDGIGQGEKMPVSLHIERADWIKKKKSCINEEKSE